MLIALAMIPFMGILPFAPAEAAVSSAESTETGLAPPVIAILDTGINPYHLEFRNEGGTNPLIEHGIASPLPLNLTMPMSGPIPLTEDSAVWESVQPETLYWFPNTKVYGAISFADHSSPVLLDTRGHGTAVSTVCCGSKTGVAPNALLLAVHTDSFQSFVRALDWIGQNPWVDVVSISAGAVAGVICDTSNEAAVMASRTRAIAESGRPVFVASGNAVEQPNFLDCFSGPPWVTRVGGAYPDGRAYEVADTKPAELLGYYNWRVAVHDSVAAYRPGFGTSFSAPAVAGHAAQLIAAARQSLGAPTPGCECLAKGTPGINEAGPLGDGELDANELKEVLMAAAVPAPVVYYVWAPTDYVTHGLVNASAAELGVEILHGREPPPPKPEADEWYARWQALRTAIWG